MANVIVQYRFIGPTDTVKICTETIEVCHGMVDEITNLGEERVREFDVTFGVPLGCVGNIRGWKFIDWTIINWEDKMYGSANPHNFADLDAYADFVNQVETHGAAYILRYEDIGESAFDDEYRGAWDSEKDFVKELYEASVDIPPHLVNYIDWDAVTHDIMMAYSSYEDEDKVHIFQDWKSGCL
jgi:antirestriction protein